MPDISQIHIDQALTNISQRVTNSELVADLVWPMVPVRKDSDKYFKYDKSNLRPENDEWAPKTTANEVNWNVTTDGYATNRRALQQIVEDDEVQNADSPLDVMADTTATLTEKMMIRKEKLLATFLSDVANFDGDAQPTLGVGDQWDNFASPTSDPNEDIATARITIFKKIFIKPNLVVLPRTVYEKVREHPKIFERIKFVQKAVVTADILASLWDVDKVVIAGAGENTAPEGQAESLSFIWPKNAWVGWVTPRPTLRSPSWGYRITSQRETVERWRDNERKGEVIRVSTKYVHELVTKGAGYVIQSAVA